LLLQTHALERSEHNKIYR